MSPAEHSHTPPGSSSSLQDGEPRRSFLTTASGVTMTAGLVSGYGIFGTMLGRFVYPAATENRSWLFVCPVTAMNEGDALDYVAPSGAKIVIARQGPGVTADDFLALSSVCPHLGCRVHWEGQHNRFFCPCHNGAFDREGNATEGPPKTAHQSLVRFALKVDEGLLYIHAPMVTVASAAADSADNHQEQGVV